MKWKRRLKIVLIVAASLLIIAAGLSWRIQAQLEQRIAGLRAAGAPVSMNDLASRPVPAGDNAATYLLRISDDANKLYGELEPSVHREDFSWLGGLTAAEIAAAEEAFESYPKVLPALEKAANSPAHQWPHDMTDSPTEFIDEYLDSIGQWRIAARILNCRARYLASVGEHDQAAAVYLQQLRLAGLQQHEPLLIAFLTNIVMRQVAVEGLNCIIQTAVLMPETHRAIEQALAAQDSMDHIVTALESERAFGIESFRTLRNPVSLLTSDWINYLDFMAAQIELGSASHYQLKDAKMMPASSLLPFSALVAPAIEASRNAMNRVRGMSRCVRIVNALYAQAIQDEPVDIESLGLTADTLIDPFSGDPLDIQKTPGGWKVGNAQAEHDGRIGIGIDACIDP